MKERQSCSPADCGREDLEAQHPQYLDRIVYSYEGHTGYGEHRRPCIFVLVMSQRVYDELGGKLDAAYTVKIFMDTYSIFDVSTNTVLETIESFAVPIQHEAAVRTKLGLTS